MNPSHVDIAQLHIQIQHTRPTVLGLLSLRGTPLGLHLAVPIGCSQAQTPHLGFDRWAIDAPRHRALKALDGHPSVVQDARQTQAPLGHVELGLSTVLVHGKVHRQTAQTRQGR